VEDLDDRRAYLRGRDIQRLHRLPVRLELVGPVARGRGKDAMNAMGIGGFFFTTNYSQMLTLHVAVLPAFVKSSRRFTSCSSGTRGRLSPIPPRGRRKNEQKNPTNTCAASQ